MSLSSATPESRKEVAADDLARAVALGAEVLGKAPEDAWSQRAGSLKWDCWETIEHIATAHYLYGSQLGRRNPAEATRIVHMEGSWPERPNLVMHANREQGPDGLLQLMEASASLLGAMVRTSSVDARVWHPLGVTDPEGCAAMGTVEVVVHAYDVAAGLAVDWTPPAEVCTRALDRLFPDVTVRDGDEPWPTLLWATGRRDLPGRERRTDWVWDNSPRSDRT
jgi:hypothetical protein